MVTRRGSTDDADRRLLSLLLANARQSTMAMAKSLGLARTTVHERINRLERNGTILGYTAVLSSDPDEGQVQSVVLLSIVQKEQRHVIERLKTFREIKLCMTINGEFDLMLSIEAPHNEDIDAVIDEIVVIPGVERAKSMFVLSTKFDRRTAVAQPFEPRIVRARAG